MIQNGIHIRGSTATPAYTLRATTAADTDWINWLEARCMRAYAEALWENWRVGY